MVISVFVFIHTAVYKFSGINLVISFINTKMLEFLHDVFREYSSFGMLKIDRRESKIVLFKVYGSKKPQPTRD